MRMREWARCKGRRGGESPCRILPVFRMMRPRVYQGVSGTREHIYLYREGCGSSHVSYTVLCCLILQQAWAIILLSLSCWRKNWLSESGHNSPWEPCCSNNLSTIPTCCISGASESHPFIAHQEQAQSCCLTSSASPQ